MYKMREVFEILEKEVKKFKIPVVDGMNDKFKVLVSAMLSARTKDEVTFEVCDKLFKKVKDFRDFRDLSVKEIEKLIYGVGFYKNKSRYLKKLEELEKVPEDFERLMKLDGVGRKTANLVLIVGFKEDRICVDVHVHRISNRLGWVKSENEYETEIELMKKIDKKYWNKINKLFVAYGKNICKPVSPFCSKCKIREYCKRVGVVRSR
ncbi:endonuclease III [archaeon]|nr:endonuclease III [archaeon]